jgi:DNA-damage-inducible protein J
MATTNVTMRIDATLKSEADELFADMGLNLSAAFVCFVKQAVREQRMPFRPSRKIPNRETARAIREVRRLQGTDNKEVYADFDALLSEVRREMADES